MKRIISVIATIVLAICALSGCGSAGSQAGSGSQSASGSQAPVSSKKISIVTTIFPEYDWVKNVLGDSSSNADITLLLDKGVDLHSFQPTARDIMKISSCDLFIYVGGESDDWVKDALKEAVNKNMVTVNLMDVLKDELKEEEIVEGMQSEGEEPEEEEPEYDEHIWLSLKNASKAVSAISDALQKVDEANKDTYKKNASEYVKKLNALDGEYKKAVEGASIKTLLFGDRFPFRYLVDDYKLSYFAAFIGCSAETEASFETISFLAKKTDELSLHAVMTIDGSDKKIAETIIKNTKAGDQKILTLDSMQTTTSKESASGTTYLSIMEKNLSVLKEALK
ncbi:MAG: zinc ABC transporter substrate-binding protein [Lachnospiraceae bacterium]|nr:zinc ABC transporter substrate-binding protein [Lachnospiraceae bacterium]